MKKSLSLRIAQRAQQNTLSCRANKAAFLAIRLEVKQALEDGWPLKSIWETLYEEGGVRFGYQTFCRYTHQLMATSQTQNPPSSSKSPPSKSTNQTLSQLPSFTFQPNLDKKDIF